MVGKGIWGRRKRGKEQGLGPSLMGGGGKHSHSSRKGGVAESLPKRGKGSRQRLPFIEKLGETAISLKKGEERKDVQKGGKKKNHMGNLLTAQTLREEKGKT